MQGLTEKTNVLFEPLSKLDCINGFTLVGGTALSLQIGNRLSEDLDFCKWSTNLKSDKPIVDWPKIKKQLESIGEVEKLNILDFDHVNFVVNGVRITFLSKQQNLSPVKKHVNIHNNIIAADIASLGIMKVEVMLRRSEWRDYYDIYSLLMEKISLKEMIDGASKYSNHKLKTRDALNFLSNGNNYKKTKEFNLLQPVYHVDSIMIETLIKSIIIKEYSF